jgi:hypothetical protein
MVFKAKENIKCLLVAFMMLTSVLPLNAQDVQIEATVSKNKVSQDEQFEYKVEVKGASVSLPNPEIPPLEGLLVLSGPMSSTSVQIINGKMSQSKSFTYILQAQNLGKVTIDPATIVVNGNQIASNKIEIEVIKADKVQTQQNQPASRNDQDISGGDLYLQAQVDKKTVYQNEQIVVTYVLYYRASSVRSYNLEKMPANPGFWTEDFDIPSQPTVESEIINGVAYNKAVLKKVALFPTQSGELSLEPMTITLAVLQRKRTRSIFDSFFDDPFGRTIQKTIASKPVKITVKPFPVQQKPGDFTGAVGKYTISAKSDKKAPETNEAVAITLSLAGQGNIKLLKIPEIKLPPDMEVYDPKESTRISRDKADIQGEKTVEYIVVPRLAGEYTLPPVTFSYFDARDKKYKTLRTDPIVLQIAQGQSGLTGVAGSDANYTRQEVELLGEDIRFIKEAVSFYSIGSKIYLNWKYLILYLFPVIGLVVVYSYQKQRDKLIGNVVLAKQKKAGKIAAKHLSNAKKALKVQEPGLFYRTLTQALQGFVSDKLNIQMTDFTTATVKRNLSQMNVSGDDIAQYQECLDECDYRQYAGEKSNPEEMLAFFEKAKQILTKLEKYI